MAKLSSPADWSSARTGASAGDVTASPPFSQSNADVCPSSWDLPAAHALTPPPPASVVLRVANLSCASRSVTASQGRTSKTR
eukprot:scaffold879_cov410-Prasinococcus_capsulatus_cf.AAC.8